MSELSKRLRVRLSSGMLRMDGKYYPNSFDQKLMNDFGTLELRLENISKLSEEWRDWAGQTGDSAYSEVMTCANELEEALGGDKPIKGG